MRDWYKEHINKKKGFRIPVYAIIAINVVVAFTIFRFGQEKLKPAPAQPYILSQKLTSDVAKKNVRSGDPLESEEPEMISYIIESAISNLGKEGPVKLTAKLIREDTTLVKVSTFNMKEKEKLKTIINFDPIKYKDLKRDYELEIIGLKER